MKADGPPGPLVSLGGGSSAEQQASTSKLLHQYSAAEQQQQELFGAPGPRDDVFSLRGGSYMTGGKGRALGCVSPAKRSLLFRVSVLRRSQMCPQPPPPFPPPSLCLQGGHVGVRVRELGELPSLPAGGARCRVAKRQIKRRSAVCSDHDAN